MKRTALRLRSFWFAALALLLAATGCHSGEGHSGEASAKDGTTPAVSARIVGEVLLAGLNDSSGIQVYIPGTSMIAITGKDGRFVLEGLAPGQYEILARADGYEPAQLGQVTVVTSPTKQQYNLAPATLKSRSVKAPPPVDAGTMGSIKGSVAIAGSTIKGPTGIDWTQCVIDLEKTPFRTTCDSEGNFLLWSLPPDQYSLTARLPGYEPVRMSVRVLPGPEPTTVKVELKPANAASARRITGMVELIGADGNPSNDFDRVTVQAVGRPDLATTLNADGSFALNNLMPAKYLITASAAGFAPASPASADLTSQAQVELLLTLHAVETTSNTTGRVHGIALKNVENETNHSGITVALAGANLMAMTDETGKFAIASIPPGSYKVIAQAEGFKPAEQGPIEIKAGQDLEIEGLLLDQELDYPEVLSVDPPDGTRNLLLRREMSFLFRFSKKMNPDSLRKAFHIDPPAAFRIFVGQQQAEAPPADSNVRAPRGAYGTTSRNQQLGTPGEDVMRVVVYGAVEQPVARYRTHYTMTIDENATDFEGLNLQEPFKAGFTTGAPSVVATLPAPGGMKADIGSARPVAVYFNAAMDHSTIGTDSVRIRPNSSAAPILSMQDDPLTGWTKLYIATTWNADTQYRVTITSGPRTTSNETLSNTPYTFSFKTAKLYLYPLPQGPQPVQ